MTGSPLVSLVFHFIALPFWVIPILLEAKERCVFGGMGASESRMLALIHSVLSL